MVLDWSAGPRAYEQDQVSQKPSLQDVSCALSSRPSLSSPQISALGWGFRENDQISRSRCWPNLAAQVHEGSPLEGGAMRYYLRMASGTRIALVFSYGAWHS